MLFLVDFDRRAGQLTSLKRFSNEQRKEAEDARLLLELQLQRAGIEREVVLLDASDEESLRKTHRRYFETWEAIAASA